MKGSEDLKVAYIVSMPHGLDAWTFRDIDLLEQAGVKVALYPLKYERGPYMPRPDWECHRLVPLLAALRQPIHFIRRPVRYLSLAVEAVRTRSLIDFVIGMDVASQMSSSGVEMVHSVFGDHKLFVGYYCKKVLRLPLSVALYGFDLRFNPNWTLFKKAVRSADAVVVNCDFNRQLLAQIAGGAIAERARVVRHYADPPRAHDQDPLKVLIVGRLEERKGHDLLFQAVRVLRDRAVSVEVWVAGVPGQIDVRALAKSIGVDGLVRFFGAVSDEVLEFLYQQCDVFCLPSRTDRYGVSEGLPVALIEAMAHGKPVVSTRLAGIPELVEQGLVDEGDVEALASSLEDLAKSRELREVLGRRNLEIVSERYSRRNVDALRDLFRETACAVDRRTFPDERPRVSANI